MFLRFYRLLTLLTGCLCTFGCQTVTTEPASSGYEYFPLETGRYIVYDVQETQYALNAAPVQRNYQLKEVIGPAYTDVTGQTAYRLVRYRRSADTQSWQADSVWAARLVSNEAVRTENGLDFVKLVFPVSDRLSWDGNRRNKGERDDYETRNRDQPYRVSDKQYDKTITVVAQNDSTLVSQDKRIEVYAQQIGLIYKEKTQVQFCAATPACLGAYQIDYGIQQVYRIRTYGKE